MTQASDIKGETTSNIAQFISARNIIYFKFSAFEHETGSSRFQRLRIFWTAHEVSGMIYTADIGPLSTNAKEISSRLWENGDVIGCSYVGCAIILYR